MQNQLQPHQDGQLEQQYMTYCREANSTDPERLLWAAQGFVSLKGYKNSAALAQHCRERAQQFEKKKGSKVPIIIVSGILILALLTLSAYLFILPLFQEEDTDSSRRRVSAEASDDISTGKFTVPEEPTDTDTPSPGFSGQIAVNPGEIIKPTQPQEPTKPQ